MTERMGQETYEVTQALLLGLARQVRLLPLEEFLAEIKRAETLGPIVDPTSFRAAMKNLEAIKKMAEGALAFKNSLPEVCAHCGQKEVAYKGAKYCGGACSARAEAHEPPPAP